MRERRAWCVLCSNICITKYPSVVGLPPPAPPGPDGLPGLPTGMMGGQMAMGNDGGMTNFGGQSAWGANPQNPFANGAGTGF